MIILYVVNKCFLDKKISFSNTSLFILELFLNFWKERLFTSDFYKDTLELNECGCWKTESRNW
jgi:hypothetical protein